MSAKPGWGCFIPKSFTLDDNYCSQIDYKCILFNAAVIIPADIKVLIFYLMRCTHYIFIHKLIKRGSRKKGGKMYALYSNGIAVCSRFLSAVRAKMQGNCSRTIKTVWGRLMRMFRETTFNFAIK